MHDRYSGHATTFEAAVHGFGSVQELRKIRKEVKAKFPPAQVRGSIRLPSFQLYFSRAGRVVSTSTAQWNWSTWMTWRSNIWESIIFRVGGISET